MNKISLECSNAEDFFQQLNKLNATYEEFVKLGKEAIPLAEKNLKQLLADESEKAQTFDDVSFLLLTHNSVLVPRHKRNSRQYNLMT